MLTTISVPVDVTPQKVLEWILETPEQEGVHLVGTFAQECRPPTNWLLFYFWCYSQTNGFTHPCCKNWDYGKLGNKYATSREGVRDAFLEFSKFDDTNMLDNQDEIEALYIECAEWCQGVVYKPVPPPPPPPKPEPEPQKPGNDTGWISTALTVLSAIAGVASLFLPKYIGAIIDIVIKLLRGLAPKN